MPLCFIFKSFIVLHVAKKLKKGRERIARKGLCVCVCFFLKIYIYNCSCGYCGFFWVDQKKKKKIKCSFLGDIRGKKMERKSHSHV